MVRFASTLIFESLIRSGIVLSPLSEHIEAPQYGFTAPSTEEPVGPKLVRITDLQDGKIEWSSVPYCICPNPAPYILRCGDILFARTGATTGKTHFVLEDSPAVFASYLIRVRPHKQVEA